MKRNFKMITLLALVLVLAMPTLVFAHGMHVHLEGNTVSAEYDGGGFPENAEVKLFDKDDNEIGSGNLDSEGNYTFDSSLKVAKASVSDGMGHKGTATPDAKEINIPKVPVVIGVFVVIVGIFYFSNKKKKAA